MASFEFDAAIRWARFGQRRTLARRADGELPFLSEAHLAGPALLLDTCVYIDQLQDRSPDSLDRLATTRQVNHSTAAIQELMHAVGVLSPDDHRTPATVAAIRSLILPMPTHRVFTPDARVLGRAALLAAIVCRLQGYRRPEASRPP